MKKKNVAWLIAALMVMTMLSAGIAFADGPDTDDTLFFEEAAAAGALYTREAVAIDPETLPGVYETKAYPGDSKDGENPATMGIPSVAKQTLDAVPTTESPAIIMGAAVNYERKTGPTTFEPFVEGTERVAPYSYFRWGVMDEQVQNEDGSISVHQKLSGFDGTYYIIRVDVSEIIKGCTEDQYLHVRQESNKALMCAYGIEGTTFSDALGNKTGSYSLANNARALKDSDDPNAKPYLDVIVLSSGKLAAGADAGAEDAPSADINLFFYVDGTEDYIPEMVLYDAASMPTFPAEIAGTTYQTEQDYLKAVHTKFYRPEKATEENNASGYLVKGSDLEIDVMVDETESPDGINEFWSLTKAMDYQAFDSHTIKLICEVPVLEGLRVNSTTESRRSVILDVNSFDIQIANNTEQKTAGLTIENNSELRIKDGTNTSGAELAIGNNATMVIKSGGVLLIDETCTNEVEYDAATTTDPGQSHAGDQFNGEITIEEGGLLINYGVVNIEGPEAKPQDPNQQESQEGQQVITDMKTADMIIHYGGEFRNYGCLSLKGILYVNGTLNNYGKYNDTIDAYDPDKGTTSYHRGIQITWKDVVTKEGVEPGFLNIGIDADKNIDDRAVVNNYGDIVVFPGTINLYGTFNNKALEDGSYAGHLYLCTVTEAIIPIIPTQEAPLVREKRITLDTPKESVFNRENGTVTEEEGSVIGAARMELIHNGVSGALIPSGITDESIVLSASDFTYNGDVQKPAVTVTVDGKTLTKNTDYTVTWKDASSKDAGTYSVTVTGTGNYTGTSAGATYKINRKEITPVVSLSASSYIWNGKARKPSVKVKDGKTVIDPANYSVKYRNNRNVGRATVTVKMKGNYKGSGTVAFKINPKRTAIRSLTAAAAGAITVKWNKQDARMSSSRITGYQIQLARDSEFTKNKKTITVSGYGKVSKKVTGLKSGKKYYVRIRTYKTAGGKKYYSTWSKVKTAKVK